MTRPNAQVQYVDAQGRLTIAGLQLLEQIARDIADLKARVTALEP